MPNSYYTSRYSGEEIDATLEGRQALLVSGSHPTLADLQTAFPSGDTGRSYKVEADGNVYAYNPNTGNWESLGPLVGPQGLQGVSISSVERTSGDGSPGTDDIYTVFLETGGIAGDFTVHNGSDGTSIARIILVDGDGSPGTLDTYNIMLSDGTVGGSFSVWNGENGISFIGLEKISGDGSPGSTDVYNVNLSDGSTAGTVSVYNGKDGTNIGDMEKSVYDPQNKAQDVFKYVDDALAALPEPTNMVTVPGGGEMLMAPELGVGPYTIKFTPDEGGGSGGPVSRTVTLTAAGWDALAQTVSVPGVLADETKQLITPTPAAASQADYYAAGILCTAQAAGSLTFTAKTAPTADLTVYVVIQEVSA